ncbi:MAG: hypothetical protein PHX30_03185 [Candidatus Pacebacteria bacterium]|nr:hypothetical protein [Candidatus Paceibacterota bacterium]
MTTETKSNYKFRGGLSIGIFGSTWPNGILEVSQASLVLRDELMKKEYKLSKGDIIRIEVKKYFPIIGYGIRIYHNNKRYDKSMFFWYWSYRMDKLTNALKELGWMA